MDEIVKPSPPLLDPADRPAVRSPWYTHPQVVRDLVMVLVCGIAVGFAVYQMQRTARNEKVLVDFQSSVYERCLKRQLLDTAAHDAVSSNAEFYATLEAIAADAPIRPGLDAKTRALIERQKAAIHKARTDAERVSQASLPGSCETYRPDR